MRSHSDAVWGFIGLRTKSTAYPDKLPARYAGEQCAKQRTQQFWPAVTASGLTVDVRTPLEAAQRRYGQPMYRKYDSHFAPRGAVTYAQTLMGVLDPSLAKGTTVQDRGPGRAPGDLGNFIGKKLSEPVESLQIERAAYDVEGQPAELRTSITHVHNTTTGATLTQPTIILGDSFRVVAQPGHALLWQSRVAAQRDQPRSRRRYNALIDRQTVIYEIVERSAATGYAGLSSRRSAPSSTHWPRIPIIAEHHHQRAGAAKRTEACDNGRDRVDSVGQLAADATGSATWTGSAHPSVSVPRRRVAVAYRNVNTSPASNANARAPNVAVTPE
jgi:hypothetical protein